MLQLSLKKNQRNAFTLVELLVVIGIIGLLLSILLPTLSRARESSRSVACKALLRQYAIASELYVNDNVGWTVDSYAHLDYDKGLVKYMASGTMPQDVARCPSDQQTEESGRLGVFNPVRSGDGTGPNDRYEVIASIGTNENSTSASRRPSSAPAGYSAIWVKRSSLMKSNPTKIMTWADWQNYDKDPTPGEAVVKPFAVGMGNVVFRHNNVMNSAFLDGHVGEIRPGASDADGTKVELTNNGHDIVGAWPMPPGATSFNRDYKQYAPFGPGKTRTGFYHFAGNWSAFVAN